MSDYDDLVRDYGTGPRRPTISSTGPSSIGVSRLPPRLAGLDDDPDEAAQTLADTVSATASAAPDVASVSPETIGALASLPEELRATATAEAQWIARIDRLLTDYRDVQGDQKAEYLYWTSLSETERSALRAAGIAPPEKPQGWTDKVLGWSWTRWVLQHAISPAMTFVQKTSGETQKLELQATNIAAQEQHGGDEPPGFFQRMIGQTAGVINPTVKNAIDIAGELHLTPEVLNPQSDIFLDWEAYAQLYEKMRDHHNRVYVANEQRAQELLANIGDFSTDEDLESLLTIAKAVAYEVSPRLTKNIVELQVHAGDFTDQDRSEIAKWRETIQGIVNGLIPAEDPQAQQRRTAIFTALADNPHFKAAVHELASGKISAGRALALEHGADPGTFTFDAISGAGDLGNAFIDAWFAAGATRKVVQRTLRGVAQVDDVYKAALRTKHLRQASPDTVEDLVTRGEKAVAQHGAEVFQPAVRRHLKIVSDTANQLLAIKVARQAGESVDDLIQGVSSGINRTLRRFPELRKIISALDSDVLDLNKAIDSGLVKTKVDEFGLEITKQLDEVDIFRWLTTETGFQTLLTNTPFNRLYHTPVMLHLSRWKIPFKTSKDWLRTGIDFFADGITEARAGLKRQIDEAEAFGRTGDALALRGQLLLANLHPARIAAGVKKVTRTAPSGAFRVNDPNALAVFSDLASLLPAEQANRFINLFGAASTVAERKQLVQQVYHEGMRLSGVFNTPEGAEWASRFLATMANSARRQRYGVGDDDIIRFADGTSAPAAYILNQTDDMIAVPDFKLMAAYGRRATFWNGVLGSKAFSTEFWDFWVHRMWGPAVLLRLGFPIRAGGEELLTMMMREKFSNLFRARFAATTATPELRDRRLLDPLWRGGRWMVEAIGNRLGIDKLDIRIAESLTPTQVFGTYWGDRIYHSLKAAADAPRRSVRYLQERLAGREYIEAVQELAAYDTPIWRGIDEIHSSSYAHFYLGKQGLADHADPAELTAKFDSVEDLKHYIGPDRQAQVGKHRYRRTWEMEQLELSDDDDLVHLAFNIAELARSEDSRLLLRTVLDRLVSDDFFGQKNLGIDARFWDDVHATVSRIIFEDPELRTKMVDTLERLRNLPNGKTFTLPDQAGYDLWEPLPEVGVGWHAAVQPIPPDPDLLRAAANTGELTDAQVTEVRQLRGKAVEQHNLALQVDGFDQLVRSYLYRDRQGQWEQLVDDGVDDPAVLIADDLGQDTVDHNLGTLLHSLRSGDERVLDFTADLTPETLSGLTRFAYQLPPDLRGRALGAKARELTDANRSKVEDLRQQVDSGLAKYAAFTDADPADLTADTLARAILFRDVDDPTIGLVRGQVFGTGLYVNPHAGRTSDSLRYYSRSGGREFDIDAETALYGIDTVDGEPLRLIHQLDTAPEDVYETMRFFANQLVDPSEPAIVGAVIQELEANFARNHDWRDLVRPRFDWEGVSMTPEVIALLYADPGRIKNLVERFGRQAGWDTSKIDDLIAYYDRLIPSKDYASYKAWSDTKKGGAKYDDDGIWLASAPYEVLRRIADDIDLGVGQTITQGTGSAGVHIIYDRLRAAGYEGWAQASRGRGRQPLLAKGEGVGPDDPGRGLFDTIGPGPGLDPDGPPIHIIFDTSRLKVSHNYNVRELLDDIRSHASWRETLESWSRDVVRGRIGQEYRNGVDNGHPLGWIPGLARRLNIDDPDALELTGDWLRAVKNDPVAAQNEALLDLQYLVRRHAEQTGKPTKLYALMQGVDAESEAAFRRWVAEEAEPQIAFWGQKLNDSSHEWVELANRYDLIDLEPGANLTVRHFDQLIQWTERLPDELAEQLKHLLNPRQESELFGAYFRHLGADAVGGILDPASRRIRGDVTRVWSEIVAEARHRRNLIEHGTDETNRQIADNFAKKLKGSFGPTTKRESRTSGTTGHTSEKNVVQQPSNAMAFAIAELLEIRPQDVLNATETFRQLLLDPAVRSKVRRTFNLERAYRDLELPRVRAKRDLELLDEFLAAEEQLLPYTSQLGSAAADDIWDQFVAIQGQIAQAVERKRWLHAAIEEGPKPRVVDVTDADPLDIPRWADGTTVLRAADNPDDLAFLDQLAAGDATVPLDVLRSQFDLNEDGVYRITQEAAELPQKARRYVWEQVKWNPVSDFLVRGMSMLGEMMDWMVRTPGFTHYYAKHRRQSRAAAWQNSPMRQAHDAMQSLGFRHVPDVEKRLDELEEVAKLPPGPPFSTFAGPSKTIRDELLDTPRFADLRELAQRLDELGYRLSDQAGNPEGLHSLLTRTVRRLRNAEQHAIDLAFKGAVDEMVEWIDSTPIRSFAQQYARNLAPFWWAEERFLKRLAKTLYRNPESIRKLELGWQGLTNTGVIEQDRFGNAIYYYPLSGWVLHFTSNVMRLSGMDPDNAEMWRVYGQADQTLAGLDSFGRPGWNPLIGYVARRITGMHPEIRPTTEGLLGEATIASERGLFESFAPTSFLRFRDAISNSQVLMDSRRDAVLALTLAGADEEVNPNDPESWQRFNDKVTDFTRAGLWLRAIYGLAGPASPRIELADAPLRSELHELIADFGFTEGLAEFEKRFPGKSPLIISTSEILAKTALPATYSVRVALESNEEFFRSYKLAGPHLIDRPQDSEFDREAWALINDYDLRQDRSMEDIYRLVKFNQAAPTYFSSRARRDQALEAAAGDGEAQKRIKDSFKAWAEDYFAANPTFAAELMTNSRDLWRDQFINEMTQALNDPRLVETPQVRKVATLFGSFTRFRDEYEKWTNLNTTEARNQRKTLRESFASWATTYVAANPEIQDLWLRVLIYETNVDREDFTEMLDLERSAYIDAINKNLAGGSEQSPLPALTGAP